MASVSHIQYNVVWFWMEVWVQPERKIPYWYVSLHWEKVLQNKAASKSASDRILMDVSDAMENIKSLIWNEVSHSPAFHLLQQARPVELTPFTQRQNGAFSIT